VTPCPSVSFERFIAASIRKDSMHVYARSLLLLARTVAVPWRLPVCPTSPTMSIRGTPAPTVQVEADPEAVSQALCKILEGEASQSIRATGRFTFAISGGSMLSFLKQLDGATTVDWSKCTMGFVSHRCVPLDSDGATYHKARPAFLDSWVAQGLTVLCPTGTTDADKEAEAYEASLRASVASDVRGLPSFDLCLIGVGLDGHVGSIYPNIPDVESRRPIVPITGMDGMGAISTKLSMSLPAMAASKRSVGVCAGRSAKAPLGKAKAMVRALEAEETPMSFPASALRHAATWLLDEDSAMLLSEATRGGGGGSAASGKVTIY